MMKLFNCIVLASLFFLASCTSQKQVINNYLQNVSDTSGRLTLNMPQPKIKKDDLLYIKVMSKSLKAETDIPYNPPVETIAGTGGNSGGGTSVSGFLVDAEGNIVYPRIGLIHVEGLTKAQLAEVIKNKLAGQLEEPNVVVRFVNYKVSVLGEVKNPGIYTVSTDRVTILDALGLAGDITEFGNRNSVKILRENNDQMEVATVDLTSKDLFSSPYFRLQQNDQVIVEQTRRKLQQQEQQSTAQKVSTIVSVITAVALILNFIK